MLHHRPVSTSPLPFADSPLLGPSPQARNGLPLTPKQMQQVGGALLALLLLFAGTSYFSTASRVRRRSLSQCSDRLAAAGLELSAAASLRLPGAYPDDPSAAVIYEKALDRQALYGELGSEVARKGMLLGHEMLGATTQSQLFDKVSKPGSWKKAYVKAILRPVEHPVRSIVLPLHDSDAAVQITTAAKRALHELLSPDSVWWQDEHLMHAPLFHATIVESPAPSTLDQLHAEANAVATVGYSHCPIHAVLDRLVVTQTGTIMALWQVLPGSTEPAVLREALRASLPQAPPAEQQPVRFPAMLHTTVGRLLAPPRRPDSPGHPGMEWDMVWLQSSLLDALGDVSDELCGLTTTFSELWYVQEKELMALALDGHYTKRASHLKCHRKAPATATV